MSKKGSSFKDALQNVFATSAILIAFIVAYILYSQIMGNPVNFEVEIQKVSLWKVTILESSIKVVTLFLF
jgi:hypothetical protein